MAESIKKLGMYSTESVKKHTGKSWDQWIQILDKAGAHLLSHQEIVALLKKKYKLDPWWQQGVTGGYEIHSGRRVFGQNSKGDFATTSTKTLNITPKNLWKLLLTDEGLQCWLKPLSEFGLTKGEAFETEDGFFGEVRTVKAGLRARLKWQDPEWDKASIMQIYLAARPGGKCILVFSHENLSSARLRESMKERWKEALEAIAALTK